MFKKLQTVPAFSFILTKNFVILLAIGVIPFLGYSIGEDLNDWQDAPIIQDVWAESVEGHNYIVAISDGIGTADHFR